VLHYCNSVPAVQIANHHNNATSKLPFHFRPSWLQPRYWKYVQCYTKTPVKICGYCLCNKPGQRINTEVSMTSYKLNDQRILIRFLTEQENFPLYEMSRPALDRTQPPLQSVEGCTQECHSSWLSQDSLGFIEIKELCPSVLKKLVWDAKRPGFSQLTTILTVCSNILTLPPHCERKHLQEGKSH
jgi:hypothetical protein